MGSPSSSGAVLGGRALVVGVVLAASTASCSGWREDTAKNPVAPLPSTSAAVPADERPIQPVPAVRPKGFTDPPPGRGLNRYLKQPVTWRDCGEAKQCAEVLVPLNYAKPDSTAITLAVARRPATGPQRLGSLFLNPGGPGASGVEYVDYFKRTGLERFDIVGWDPRGVASSTPVQCAESSVLEQYTAMDNSPDTAVERTALIQTSREFGLSCLERSGPLLKHISTVETARDLNLLRQLLGDSTLTYLGSSYGTQIGAVYAHLFPRSVGRLVLDGAVDITGDSDTSQVEGFERALRSFAEWCAGRSCSLGSSAAEVEGAITTLWRQLDDEPMRVGRRQLTQQLAVTGVIWVLYENERAWPYLLQALEAAIDKEDGEVLLTFADHYNQRAADGTYGQFNYSFPAVRCLDVDEGGIRSADAELAAAAKQAPTLAPFLGPNYVCATWPVPAARDPGKLAGKGAAPIVVVGTTGDPATPYEDAVDMAEQLESAVLVTLKGTGHLAYGQSPCVQALVQSYLVKGVVPRDGTTC